MSGKRVVDTRNGIVLIVAEHSRKQMGPEGRPPSGGEPPASKCLKANILPVPQQLLGL